jgi:hypothetical protein
MLQDAARALWESAAVGSDRLQDRLEAELPGLLRSRAATPNPDTEATQHRSHLAGDPRPAVSLFELVEWVTVLDPAPTVGVLVEDFPAPAAGTRFGRTSRTRRLRRIRGEVAEYQSWLADSIAARRSLLDLAADLLVRPVRRARPW